MATRRPLVLDDDGEAQELQDGDEVTGAMPAPTGVGQLLISVDGSAFVPTLWLVDDNGFPIVDEDGYPVTDD